MIIVKLHSSDWEQRNLSKVLKVNSGKDYKHLSKGNIPVYGTGGYMLSVNDKLSDKNGIGIGRKGTIDKPQFLKAPFWTVDTLFYLTSLPNHDLLFLYYLIQNINWKRFDESTGVPSLSKKTIEGIVVHTPNTDEQILLGRLLKKIDITINLHQRKVERLQSLKNGMLQQLFPHQKDGSLSLCFPKYQNKWEVFKLDDITERIRGNDGRMDLPTLTISASKGWLNQKERFSQNIAGKEQKNYTLLKKGMLSYNKGNSKVAPYGIAYKLENYKEALVPRVYHSFTVKENASEDFIEYLFTSRKVDKELAKIITSGARMDGLLNINYEDFSSINIPLPQIAEQKRIAKILKQIDTVIESSNKKNEILQLLKKAYLEKMFI